VILHGFDGIQPLRLEGKLAGVLLISPWVSFSIDTPSWTENVTKDVISQECLFTLTPCYVDPKDQNNYSEPALADAKWWSGIPAQKILNVYGGYELFRDHIVQFGQKLHESGNPVDNVGCAKQVHIDCVLDAQTGMEAGEMSQVIWKWLGAVFSPCAHIHIDDFAVRCTHGGGIPSHS
jgi:acetyl esterase/lipase